MTADNSAVTLAVVAILATCVTGLLWVIRFMFTKLLPVIDRGAISTEKLVEVTKQNTRQIKTADLYQRNRNGRDTEMHKELIKAIGEIPAQIIASADITAKTLKKNPASQNIDTQKVGTQVIKGKK